jgi:predicted HTH domain antitoxin
MTTVPVELPEETFVAARRSPDEVAREMKTALAFRWYEQGLVSQGMAAQIAGVSRSEFLDTLAAFGVAACQETIEDIDKSR